MSNANENSDNKSNKPLVNSEVKEDSNALEFSNEESLPTNNRLVTNLKKFSNSESSHYISKCSGYSMGLMEIIKLKNILNYKDLRSVINWCTKNDVFVFQQGNTQFVNQWEFILSFYKPFITHLKRKHENWKEMFLNYLSGELGVLLGTSKEEVTVRTNYKAKTKSQISFRDKLKNI